MCVNHYTYIMNVVTFQLGRMDTCICSEKNFAVVIELNVVKILLYYQNLS